MRIAVVIATITGTLLLAGCSSIASLGAEERKPPQQRNFIYGGLRYNLAEMDTPQYWLLLPFSLTDLGVSTAWDTALLPATITGTVNARREASYLAAHPPVGPRYEMEVVNHTTLRLWQVMRYQDPDRCRFGVPVNRTAAPGGSTRVAVEQGRAESLDLVFVGTPANPSGSGLLRVSIRPQSAEYRLELSEVNGRLDAQLMERTQEEWLPTGSVTSRRPSFASNFGGCGT